MFELNSPGLWTLTALPRSLFRSTDFRRTERFTHEAVRYVESPLNMKQITKPQKSNAEDKHVERVRRICLALPETWEKISHGEPTFFVKRRYLPLAQLTITTMGTWRW